MRCFSLSLAVLVLLGQLSQLAVTSPAGAADSPRPDSSANAGSDDKWVHVVPEWLPGEIEPFTEDFFREPADLPPGDAVHVADSIRLPDDLPPGHYRVAIAMVGDENDQPVVQLAIKGRSADGWYPLSSIAVAK